VARATPVAGEERAAGRPAARHIPRRPTEADADANVDDAWIVQQTSVASLIYRRRPTVSRPSSSFTQLLNLRPHHR